MIKTIGITGGIGSGKSYVCNIIEHMGFSVYYSDRESKRLTQNDLLIRKKLIQLLGNEIYHDHELNKPLLAQKIFHDDALRRQVNRIIHPQVRVDFERWTAQQRQAIVFNESALLIETGVYKSLDFIVLVRADELWRIQKTVARDKTNEQEVRTRMSKQWTDEQKNPYADFIIENNGQPLLVQIEKMLEEITNRNEIDSSLRSDYTA